MENSILKSVKKMLAIDPSYNHFDTDIIMHINTALVVLYQIGLGTEPFSIEGSEEEWSDLLGDDNPQLNLVKTYIAKKVQELFDPPTTGSVNEAMKSAIAELEWRISLTVDPKETFE